MVKKFLVCNIFIFVNRFFPDGKVLMLTTSEEPMQSVGVLRHRIPRHPWVLRGHYRLCNNTVTLLVQRPDRRVNNKMRSRHRDNSEDYGEQTFHLVGFLFCLVTCEYIFKCLFFY